MTLNKYLNENSHILADGAMGTLLMKKGTFDKCPEEINLSNPELLKEIAGEYFNSGSKLIQTATFGASHIRLSQFNLHREMEHINRVAVKAVRSAVEDGGFVNGALGPYGIPLDNINGEAVDEVKQNYMDQAEILLDEGVDLLSIETAMSIFEAKAAVEGVVPIAGKTPVLLSFVFIPGKAGYTTLSGEPLEKVIETFDGSGISFFGVNCGNGFSESLDVTRQIKEQIRLPLAVQPNAGIPDSDLNFPSTKIDFVEAVKKLLDLDVAIIGGCCGTTPDYIEAVRHLFSN